MRSFIDAYEARYGGGVGGGKTYAALMAKKNAALAGWIAWVVLQNPSHPHLGREAMAVIFGEWCWRTPVLAQEDGRRLLKA